MELNVLALVKGGERYIYVFDDASHAQLLDALRDQAANPNLQVNWFDYQLLCEKSREQLHVLSTETRAGRVALND